MAIFGLLTKGEARQQIEAVKAENEKAVKAAVDLAVKQVMESLPDWLAQTADAERFNLPDPSIYGNQADLFRRLSWIQQAVEITASAAALVRFDVKRIIRNEEPKDIPNHPFEMLLARPNPLDSRYEFLFATIAMWKLTGNGYWWLNRADEMSAPDELWLIPSHKIQPVPDKQMFIRGYHYFPGDGRELFLPPHEIVHFRRFNFNSRFVGLSAIEALAVVAAGDLAMQGWNTRLFGQNNARLPGILTFERMIADPQWDKIKEDTREASRNRELLMLRGVGGLGGVKWLQNSVSQKEMEFLQGREFNRNEIWNSLAPGLVSMLSENATEANSRTGMAAFNELTVWPMLVMMAEKITNEILPAYGTENARPLLGQFEDIRTKDRLLEIKEQETYAITHTIAEIRQQYYGDDPLGDERDKLLPIQVKAEASAPKEPPAVSQQQQPGQELQAAANDPQGAGEPTQTDAQKAAVMMLFTWQNKAVKQVGRKVDFDPGDVEIPGEIVRYINSYLPSCTSKSAVKAVFDNARRMVTGEKAQPADSEIITLARSIDAMAAAMQAQPAGDGRG